MARSPFGKYLCAFGIAGALVFSIFLLGTPAFAAIYNVQKFGAHGNGVNDDSQAIADAIAAASRSSGNIVEFPTGTYKIGGVHPVLAIGTSMSLFGDANAVLEFSDSASQISVTGSHVTIDTLAIANTGSDKSSGIVFDASTGSTVMRSTFTGWTNGVVVRGSSDKISVLQNKFYIPKKQTGVLVQDTGLVSIVNNHFNSLAANYGYGVYSDQHQNTISMNGNKFESLEYAVYAYGPSDHPQETITSSGNTFDNCYYGYNCQYILGLYVTGADIINNSTYGVYAWYNTTQKVTGCTINSPALYGIYMGESDNTTEISSNTISNAKDYGIDVSGNAAIQDNNITGSSTTSSVAQIGIYAYNFGEASSANTTISRNSVSGFLYGIASYYCDSVHVNANHIKKTFSCGIYTSSDTFDSIKGNELKDCAQTISGSVAVIYVDGFGGGDVDYVVTDNTYAAKSTANVRYFVYVNGPSNGITLKNNQSNTMLPSYP